MKKYVLLLAIFTASCTPEQKITLKRNNIFAGGKDVKMAVFDSPEFSLSGNQDNCTYAAKLLNKDHKEGGYTADITFFCVYE